MSRLESPRPSVVTFRPPVADVQRRLHATQARIAELTAELRHLEGVRDKLLREATDHAGCGDQRFAVR